VTIERKPLAGAESGFLVDAAHALNETLRYDKLAMALTRVVRRALSAEALVLWRVSEDGNHLVLEHILGKRGTKHRGHRIPVGDGIAGSSARRARAIRVADSSKEKRYGFGTERKLGLNARSVMAIPLVHRGDVLGVVEIVNCRKGDVFSADDITLADVLCESVATAVAHVLLRDRAERIDLEYSLFKKVTRSMGRSLTRDEVLERIIRNLGRLLDFEAAAVFVLDRNQKSIRSVLHHGYRKGADSKLHLKIDEGVVGMAARLKKGIRVDDVRKHPKYVNARRRTRSEMVAPMITRDRLIGLFNIESDHVKAYRKSDLRMLEAFAAQAAVSIERADLYEDQREKEDIEEELRLARTVQEFFSPSKSVPLGKYRLAGVNFPSLEVSGDYYDCFPVRGGQVAFAIADVAGKGVPASLIMSSFRATLHTVAPYLTSARQIAVRANQILLETVRPQDFVTAFIGVIDPSTGLVTYCNAGHNPPVLMSPDGGYRLLETGGPILGVFEEPPLQEGRFRLGDEILVCYTDGATEARNEKDEEYGEARLVSALREHRELPPYRLGRAMFASLREFFKNMSQGDDVTYLVLRSKRG